MKYYFYTFLLVNLFGFSQNNSIFQIEFESRKIFDKAFIEKSIVILNSGNKSLDDFFVENEVSNFKQMYPNSRRERNLNSFAIETKNENFGEDIILMFPDIVIRYHDITNDKYELTTIYPNDYGTTSPVINLGINAENSSNDYINAPEAWGVTFGSNQILIGISDGKIQGSDNDFINKISFLPSYPYHSTPFSMSNIVFWHGTNTAATAAAQGNNGYGMSGVCSNCSIIGGGYLNYDILLELAYNGADVINMSWRVLSADPNAMSQDVIDEIHDLGVVMVASAGNNHVTNLELPYPASHNHVISVTSVNHRFNMYQIHGPDSTIPIGNEFYNVPISYFVKDMISPRVVPNYNGTGLTVSVLNDPNKFHTTNHLVDICAPGHSVFQYGFYLLNNSTFYGDGTSSASPHVSGTIGLMLSLNNCLNPDEILDILQLTSKNIEKIQGNEFFIGRIGSGKLESGKAVKFVQEAMNSYGNAEISNHDFWRFDFKLTNINNNLTISNQIFRDDNKSEFKAKNSIRILPNSKFNPNTNGYVRLGIDPNISNCQTMNKISNKLQKNFISEKSTNDFEVLVSPNPNNGLFNIFIKGLMIDEVIIEIFDINGRLLYNQISTKNEIKNVLTIDIQNLPKGLYFVKTKSSNMHFTNKIIKR